MTYGRKSKQVNMKYSVLCDFPYLAYDPLVFSFILSTYMKAQVQ